MKVVTVESASYVVYVCISRHLGNTPPRYMSKRINFIDTYQVFALLGAIIPLASPKAWNLVGKG
jgi:hypothetical protein